MSTSSSDTAMAAATPMMQQYFAIKDSYKEYLLFYRMGDFYELFFDDALLAADILDIALTKRGKHEGMDIPMCGVPVHSYESYLHKLIKAGLKVAVCEQMESPEEARKRGYKAVVRREVVRIITPGTVIEEGLLEAASPHYLVAIVDDAKGPWGLAWLDLSTGECAAAPIDPLVLSAELARLAPKEILLKDRLLENEPLAFLRQEWRETLTPHVASFFDAARGEATLKKWFGVAFLEGFARFTSAEIAALGAIFSYVELTQKGAMPVLLPPKRQLTQHYLVMDAATRRNLELTSTLHGEYKGSVLSVINHTKTNAGARLLWHMLGSPLTDSHAIDQRLDRVDYLVRHSALRDALRQVLVTIPDMERALSRLSLKRGGPRDMQSLWLGLKGASQMAQLLHQARIAMALPSTMEWLLTKLEGQDALIALLEQALAEQVPIYAKEGGFIREGFDAALDGLRHVRDHSGELIRGLRDRYREETGIPTLKIDHNNIIGFFIEVTAGQISKLTDDRFIHRQTMVNATRYTTIELRELETKIAEAKEHILAKELAIFAELLEAIEQVAVPVLGIAEAVATMDVAASLAHLAVEHRFVRPLIDDSTAFHIEAGRHPVVEAYMRGNPFIANSCDLRQGQQLWLLTGPNMAGKSTFLRQNALIAILAQMGSFVPANSAHIGTIDRLFSRVGAADDLARGQSTFMVEMIETATILHQATSKSLVILDEIGRGTATFDGLSIAWATLEYMHDCIGARALFATHYHELTQLAERLSNLACYTMRVKEWQGEVVFMHEVIAGAADRSYGIHVAKLAGLPKVVIQRAEEVLRLLEQQKHAKKLSNVTEMPLFAFAKSQVPGGVKAAETVKTQGAYNNVPALSAVETTLTTLDVDALSPKEALDWLYRLKEEVAIKEKNI